MRCILAAFLMCSCIAQAEEKSLDETISQIEQMIQTEKRGAYLCFDEADFRLASGQIGDLWEQIQIQELLELQGTHVLKSLALPYTALHGHRLSDQWAANVFHRCEDTWDPSWAPIGHALLSTANRNKCLRFFAHLRNQKIVVVSDAPIPEKTQALLFGPDSRFILLEDAASFEPDSYSVAILILDPCKKAASQSLFDKPLFVLDLSALKEPLLSWSLETWNKWVQWKQNVKILYTSALIPYRFDERKQEYIQCLQILEGYGYKGRIYIAESGPYSQLSFFDDYCGHVFYANTNDTSFINKGVNEGKASLAAFDYFHFDDEDMMVKLTGRYLFNSDLFLRLVEEHPEVDAFVSRHPRLGMVTGCFAMRAKYYKQMLQGFDFPKMEKELIDIERVSLDFVEQMIKDHKKVIFVDKIGITANVANVEVVQW